MKKAFIASFLLVLAAGFVCAASGSASVDMDMLSKATREKYVEDFSHVAWKNFNTGKQIRDMGRRLGAEVRYQAEVNKTDYPFSSGYPDYKYKASRVYGTGKKSGADVLYVGRRARVGTFKNLNRVVSGYIERAYGISMAQADQIALKVCYWNTNHYNDSAYFKKNFDARVSDVFKNRTKRMGLARSYKEWQPTRIVIPFVLVKEVVPEAVEPAKPKEEPKPVVEEKKPEPVAPVEKKPAYEPPKPESRQRPVYVEPEPEPEPSFFAKYKWWLLVGGVLALVAIIAVIMGMRKNK